MRKRLAMLGAVAVLVLGLGIQPAQAALVQYSATGTFASTGTNSVEIGDVIITFTGFSDLVLTPSATTLGAFITSPAGGGLSVIEGQDTFTLTITQSLPTPGSSSFASATLHGQLKVLQSHVAYVLFDPGPISIGGITYLITEADNGVTGRTNLNAPPFRSGNSAPSTVSAFVTPEPGSLLLLGLGFIGAAALARRRRART